MLGGVRVYDDAPQRAPYPLITLGQSAVRDWSIGSEDGVEHSLTLHVWSRTGSEQQMLEIVEAVRAALHDKPLQVEGHHLVNLRHEFSEARLDPDGDTYHGVVRYRAVTEPAQQAAA